MSSVVCTLFEGHYHYGVAVLINSLYKKGFRGSVYAGYRGVLPFWTRTLEEMDGSVWSGSQTFNIAEGLLLHFIPLDTSYHLTNYKPDFMLRLLDGPAKEAAQIFYFDPDIVVASQWSFFHEWVECGVALCEDVNSPLDEFHPRRMAWRRHFGKSGITLKFKNSIYANGGFVGISAQSRSFLETWKSVQEAMAVKIGGLNRSSLKGSSLPEEIRGSFSAFGKTDQDALNAAVEAWQGQFSFVGQEGMAFKAGEALMPHALGHPKPWQRQPLLQAMAGIAPRLVDRAYWHHANGLIRTHSFVAMQWHKLTISLSALIGRFYRRNGV